MKTIKVCAGIGDNIWLFQKLVNTGEKFLFAIANDKPQRGKQIFDLLPSIVSDSWYSPGFTSGYPLKNDAAKDGRAWAVLNDNEMCLSINEHLEAGIRIEEYLPDLETSFTLPFETKKYALKAGRLLTKGATEYIGIYTSSYSTSRHWGFWSERDWFDLIERMNHNGNYTFILIGAEFDIDLNNNLVVMLKEAQIRHKPILGKELGFVIEIMKRLDYFIAFPSGLPIMSTILRRPCLMFYPPHLHKMQNAWADPKLLENGTYTPQTFTDVDTVYHWLKTEYKLFDRIGGLPVLT